MITFVNREEELKFLEDRWGSEKFELIIIYGRRRIGKTELVKQFLKNKKGIYFLSKETTSLDNIRSFKQAAKNILDLTYIKDDWEAVFKYISEKFQDKKLIIVIDEFPYLIRSDPSILSIFQRIIDLYLKDTKIKLILLGSSISIIEKEILSYKSPLYGRRTGQIKLMPLKFKDCVRLLGKSIEESIMIYGITGGVPLYLLEFKDKKDFWKLVEEKVLAQGSLLRDEARFLLSQEFREPSIYMAILEAIASGRNTLGEIISFCGFKDKTSISPYIRKLIFIDLVKREMPVIAKQKKKARYIINDEYFNFYFRYIYPNISAIEAGIFDISIIKNDYNTYLGQVFEKICREIVIELIKKKKIPFFTKIGKQWGVDLKRKVSYEIDLVALNDQTKEILFGECKWKEKVDAEKVIIDLCEKSKAIPNIEKYNNFYYIVFAKSFKKKIDEFEGRKVYCFDLKDIERVIKEK